VLQRLLDLRPRVLCDNLHGALTGIVQQLFVTGHAAVDLLSKSGDGATVEAHTIFDRVRGILVQSHFLDVDAPIAETRAGTRTLRVPNPYYGSLHVPARIRIDQQSDPASVILHAFLVLRVRYQTTGGASPIIRLEASMADDFSLDLLYLMGDAFTERYPVTAELTRKADKAILTLIGEPILVAGGLTWARDDYVRSRDASLLIRPLREALEGPSRPLVIPREVRGPLGEVRVRLPQRALAGTKSLRWIGTLDELRHPAGGDLALVRGRLGEHFSKETSGGGYIAAGGPTGTDAILPVRSLTPTEAKQVIVPEGDDGSIAIAFEAIGGAREIGANSYYYAFGHRGLLIDAGFDATRDGWLGLPALQQVPRVDAVVLTHAHLDHVGAVPTLLAAFPNVPVYCTRATLAVLLPQLTDSANVSDIRFRQTGEAPALSHGLVDSIRMEQFRLLDYRAQSEVPEIPGLTLEFFDAGHIIGSACARLEFSTASILHTGDISVEDQHLLRGMPVGELAADHVVMEGTYCGEPDFGREHRKAAVGTFVSALAERIDAGGSVLVPAFSLGRAQELVGMLVDWNERTGRSVPIWTVGLVNRLNQVSAAHPTFLPGLSGTPFAQVRPFPVTRNRDATEAERRDEYARVFFELAQRTPSVVIASHGMMTEGTGSYLIGRAILAGDDSRHAIFLCGYMDPRTPGFRLRYQRDEAVIDFGPGDAITRRIPSERIQFHRLTAHASYEELLDVALAIPKRSVTFIHGDGVGLDALIEDLRRRLSAAERALVLRAPAIGERVLIDRVQPPAKWEIDAANSEDAAPSLAAGRKFDRKSGLSVRGLSADGRWALIPIGQRAVALALEHDRIDTSRIDRIEVRPHHGQPIVAFDRPAGLGDPSRIALAEPDKIVWMVTARDPSGQSVRSSLTVFCGAEIRAIRAGFEAARPALEVEVGGTLDPDVLEVTAERGRRRLDCEGVSWDAHARVLRLRLRTFGALGALEDVELRIRWPNGFIQVGPSLGRFTLEPRVVLESVPAKVGQRCRARVRSDPAPLRARVGGHICAADNDVVDFVPRRPGTALLELEYATLDGECEWREVGSFQVQAAAAMDMPAGTDVAAGLEVTVRDVDVGLHDTELELVLMVGGEIRDRWTASSEIHRWSGSVPETDPLDVAIVVPGKGWTLCAGSVRVFGAFEFDPTASLAVTTADATLPAELCFVGPAGWNRAVVEEAFSAAGFHPRGWTNEILRVTGSERTVGTRLVAISDRGRQIDVQIVTLSDLHLSLVPEGPFGPGSACSLHTSAGDVAAGLESIDSGPLVVEVERVAPFFDALSARVTGNRVHFLHPGRYLISLSASGRRLAQVETQVEPPRLPVVESAPHRIELSATSPHEASVLTASCAPYAHVVILSPAREPYRIVQDQPLEAEDVVWRFLSTRLATQEKVLVSWPGLSLGEPGGRLLRRLREEQPTVAVAHLSYPAPRGEIAADEVHARTLRKHRVLCSPRASTTIDRLDSYRCTRCSGAPRLQTDTSRIWQECPACGQADRQLVLTLVGLRSTDVQVLFADYRMAKYLSRGRGKRYAGAFGRSVRCASCHALQTVYADLAPWDRAELHLLLGALAATWDHADPGRSLRSAAYIAARRGHWSRPGDVPRLEDALRRMLEAGLVEDGKCADSRQLEKLEAGVSLCCEQRLMWSERRVAQVLLDVEGLLNPSVPAAMHPDLAFGAAGVRQLLTLSE
jgi:predicted metal-dependent RNase